MTENATTQSEHLFELAAEQIEVCLRVKGATGRYELRHRLRPPMLEDWRAYERELRSTVEVCEDQPEALRFHAATLEAAGALYDRLFRSAAGYRAVPGEGEIAAERIPLHHKEMVIRALADVAPAAAESGEQAEPEAAETALFALDAGQIEVRLEAARNGVAHRGLAHVFRAPSAADRVEYSRVTSQALYVRNAQSLKTILPARLPGLVALYDRLIAEVHGYAVAGEPPADRAAIVRHMDALHKKAAVQLLFEG